ncbi:MAG: AAA family ATPase [Metallibacterium scheffleri]
MAAEDPAPRPKEPPCILLAVARGIARVNDHAAIDLSDLMLAIRHTVDGTSANASARLPAMVLASARRDWTLAMAMAMLSAMSVYVNPLSAEAASYLVKLGLRVENLDNLLEETFRDQFRVEYARMLAASVGVTKDAASTDPVKALPPLTRAQVMDAAKRVRSDLERAFLDPRELVPKIAAALMETPALRSAPKKPWATFFFVGPTATGKSFAAGIIAQALARASELPSSTPSEASAGPQDVWASTTFDLSAYTSFNQSFGLVGLTQGYADARPGELTQWIREHPRSVIILDHLDKAHPNTQNVLLELFDTGFLTDRYGFYKNNDLKQERIAEPAVDARQCIFIFTASIDGELARNAGFFERYARQPGQGKDTLLDYLRKRRSTSHGSDSMPVYDPGLLSALGSSNLLLFAPLGEAELRTLARQGLGTLKSTYAATVGIRLHWEANTELLVEASLLAHGADLDARKVTARALRDLWLPELDAYALRQDFALLAGQSLDIRFTPGTLEKLEPIKERLGIPVQLQPDGPDLVQCLRRRNRTVVFERTLDTQASPWTLTLHDPQVAVPQRAEDFTGGGALVVEVPSVRFGDVQGHVVVKQRLQQIVHLLKEPRQLEQWAVASPSGMVLHGPPGTGKTLLAKALAGEADLPFLAANGVDLLDPRFTQSLYERARHYAPALVFLDEIDVLGSRQQTAYTAAINALLSALDGFGGGSSPVFTVAATNYLERLDPALLRPGRLGLHVEVPMLDREARRGFITRYQALPGGQSLDVEALLDATTGLSGAALESVRNEAAYALLREGRAEVDTAFMREIITTERFGPRSSRALSAADKRLTALHEAGHAVVSRALFPQRRIEQVSIVPRQHMLGFTVFDREDDGFVKHTRARVLDELAVMLAGRAAQQQLGGDDGADPDSGASNDIEHATHLALRAAAQWALDPNLPPIDYTQFAANERWREDPAVRRVAEALLSEAQAHAQRAVTTYRQPIEAMAETLQREEVVSGLDMPLGAGSMHESEREQTTSSQDNTRRL